MNQTVTLSEEQAQTIAREILPSIRAYIAAHRQEYEAWLKQQRKEAT